MRPTITTRADLGWGPTEADAARPTRGLVIHFDGSNRGLARKPHSACLDYWQWCRGFHMGPARGWLDVGYSWACCPHGRILEGRGLGHEQAAQPGGNATWYSVTLMSGPAEDPTPEQITAVRALRGWLIASHGLGTAVRGHRDFVSTDCPGPRAYALVQDGTFRKDPDTVSAPEVWKHEIPVPFGTEANPEWQARNILVDVATRVRQLQAVTAVQAAAIERLTEALAAGTPVDAEAILAGIREAIEAITVRLVIEGQDLTDTPLEGS